MQPPKSATPALQSTGVPRTIFYFLISKHFICFFLPASWFGPGLGLHLLGKLRAVIDIDVMVMVLLLLLMLLLGRWNGHRLHRLRTGPLGKLTRQFLLRRSWSGLLLLLLLLAWWKWLRLLYRGWPLCGWLGLLWGLVVRRLPRDRDLLGLHRRPRRRGSRDQRRSLLCGGGGCRGGRWLGLLRLLRLLLQLPRWGRWWLLLFLLGEPKAAVVLPTLLDNEKGLAQRSFQLADLCSVHEQEREREGERQRYIPCCPFRV